MSKASRVVGVRVAEPGTHEQHITEFLLSSYVTMEQEAMVAYLMISPNTYYTHADGKTAFLEVAETATGSKYVRTKPDSTTANNLLSLPRF